MQPGAQTPPDSPGRTHDAGSAGTGEAGHRAARMPAAADSSSAMTLRLGMVAPPGDPAYSATAALATCTTWGTTETQLFIKPAVY